ncbi:transporter substrate-binding protein [Rhizobium sp. YIM 134829]|uniref:transporter substrate-binding protein n=1 Tax=Rhizobium sp. YIM 134829 TaxID=3390453 RepID=UPI00397A0C01
MIRETIPISILYSTTGPYAALGREAVNGALAAIAEVNADMAAPFRLQAKIDDPAGRADLYAMMSEAAIREQGCRHVVGTITSWSRKDVLPIVERHGALLWYAFPYEGYEASESVLYLGACPNQHLLPLFEHVLPLHGARPFIIGSNYIWGWEISRIARELTEAAGGTVVSDRFMPLGSGEVDHLIAEIAQKAPDFILSNLVGQSATAFLEAYQRLREAMPLAPPIVACNLSETDLEGLSPAARAGHITTSIYFDQLDTPENRAFRSRMVTRHGRDRHITTPFSSAYNAVSILARAIADAGTDEPEAVRRVVTGRIFETQMGPLRLDPRTQHASLRPHMAMSNEDGEFLLFKSAPEPIPADPYLVQAAATARLAPLAGDQTARSVSSPSGLKVIK